MAITTADELLRAGDLGRCELVRGVLRRMIPAGGEHGRIAGYLTLLLGGHVRSERLGTFYAAETGFVLSRNPDTVRAPDFAFVRGEQTDPVPGGFVPHAPDLAVEVLSPDDRPGYVREKVAEWIEAGTEAVWVVDPKSRTVIVHRPDRNPTSCGETDDVPGGNLLPGFELSVHEIFA